MIKRRVALDLFPLILFFALTVGVGLVNGFLQSIYAVAPTTQFAPESGRWSAYVELVQRPGFLSSLIYTIWIAAIAAVFAIVFGAVLAYVLRFAPSVVQRLGGLYHLPIILPHVVIAFITMVLWSPTGVIATLFSILGIDVGRPGFPALLNAPNGIGVIIAYVYKGFPFVTLMALGVLRFLPDRMIVTAKMLGAGPLRLFFTIGVPTMLPVLNQLFIILFLYALGGFEVPWLLGASRPQMLPVTVYSLYFQGSLSDRAVAMASLSMLAAFSAIFVAIYARVARRLRYGVRPV